MTLPTAAAIARPPTLSPRSTQGILLMSKEPTGTELPLPEDTSGSGGGVRHLRRWSVAELIARAVRPSPTTT